MKPRLFELIMAIRKKCIQTEERVRSDLNLTPGEFQSLLLLQPGEKVPGGIFSRRLGLSASRGSRVLQRLWKSGFVTLKTVPDNRRSAEASLTPKGKAMQDRIMVRMEECEHKIASRLSEMELQRIMRSLKTLVDAMV